MLAVLRGIWYNDLIMERELTADQENAKKLITEWFLNTDNRVFVLAGYAGTLMGRKGNKNEQDAEGIDGRVRALPGYRTRA